MTYPSPQVLVNSLTPPFQATDGQTITVALQSSIGVVDWDLTLYGTDDLQFVNFVAINAAIQAGINHANNTCTFTFPNAAGLGCALILKSTVNNNRDTNNTYQVGYSNTFKIHSLDAISGGVIAAFNETIEMGPTGWLGTLNDAARFVGSAGGPAGGDLSGTYPNPSVVKIQGKSLNSSLASLGSAQDGYVLTWDDADGYWYAKSATDIDTLAGDTTGPIGSNTVVNINGASVPVSGSLTTGNVLQVSGSSALSYGAVNLAGGANYVTGTLPNTNQQAQSMGGDVGGTTAASTISSLAVSKLANGTDDQFLMTNGTTPTWTTLGGDAGLVDGTLTVTQAQGGEYLFGATGTITLASGATGIITQASESSATAAANITITPQHSTHATDQTGGNLNISLQTPAGAGTEAQFNIFRDANCVVTMGPFPILGPTYGAIWFGDANTGSSATSSNFAFLGSTSTIQFNAPVGGTTYFTVGGLIVNTVIQNNAGMQFFNTGTFDLGAGSSGVIGIHDATVIPTAGATNGIVIYSDGSTLGLAGNGISIAKFITLPVIKQNDNTTGSATATNLKVQAQNATGATSVGGNLILAAGTGTSTDGYVAIQSGGTTIVEVKDTGLTVPAFSTAGVVHNNSAGLFSSSTIVDSDISASAAIAVSKLAAGTDEQFLMTNGSTPTWTTLGGDVSNVDGTITVSKINGASVPAAGSLTTGNAPYVSGSSALTYSALNLAGGAGWVSGALPIANLATGTSAQILMANATPANAWTTMSADATISATGAITLQAIKGKNLDSTLSSVGAAQDGYALTWHNASSTWQALPESGGAESNLAGDVTGPEGTNTVVAIQGQTVTSGALTKGQFFVASSTSNWAATTLSGDITESASTSGLLTVVALQGHAVESQTLGTAQDGYVLSWVNGSSQWQAQPANPGLEVRTTAASYQINGATGTEDDHHILCSNSGAINLTLPNPVKGATFEIWDIVGTSETNNITLLQYHGEKISGLAASRALGSNWGHWTVISDGTDWYLTG